MADKKASNSGQTVRERSQTNKAPRKRRVQKTANSVAKPISAASKGLKSAAKPLKPLAKPFQTKPARKIGRFLSAALLINYFRSSWQEVKRVSFPNRKTTAKLTVAVFVFALIFGAIIAFADYGLDKLFKKILLS